jgi:hypothetical protein
LFISSSKICATKEWYASRFFKEKLFHSFCNKKSILSSLEFLDLFQLLVFYSIKGCSTLYNVDIEKFSLKSLPIGVVLRFC